MSNTLDEINTYPLADGGLSLERAMEKFPNIKVQIQALITEARNDSLLDLENWAKLHDLDAEMILDGIEHMVKSNLQVPDQPRRDNSDRLAQLKENK